MLNSVRGACIASWCCLCCHLCCRSGACRAPWRVRGRTGGQWRGNCGGCCFRSWWLPSCGWSWSDYAPIWMLLKRRWARSDCSAVRRCNMAALLSKSRAARMELGWSLDQHVRGPSPPFQRPAVGSSNCRSGWGWPPEKRNRRCGDMHHRRAAEPEFRLLDHPPAGAACCVCRGDRPPLWRRRPPRC